jgi:6-pyruvoyltetrahydropterin/6-carboxytetrahydropterin synthase
VERWSILMHKEYFKFSCAHFLIFPDGSKERLHGHNYQVMVEIHGELSDRGLVIDFKRAKPIVRALCDELDEHWRIPAHHPELHFEHQADGHIAVRYRDCRYLAPTAEVIVLPVDNTSAENLATWLGRRIREEISSRFGPNKIQRLKVAVSETSGQHGTYEFASESES